MGKRGNFVQLSKPTPNLQYIYLNMWSQNKEISVELSSLAFCAMKQLEQCPVISYPPGQNGWNFADDIFSCIILNKKLCIVIKISLKFVPKGLIDNSQALV